jgi:hypothetical protein
MLSMQSAAPGDPLTDLTADYPAWHIWRGRDGRGRDADWYATRRRRLTVRETAAGLRTTLSAAVPDSLRGLLEQQEVIESGLVPTAHRLDAVSNQKRETGSGTTHGR